MAGSTYDQQQDDDFEQLHDDPITAASGDAAAAAAQNTRAQVAEHLLAAIHQIGALFTAIVYEATGQRVFVRRAAPLAVATTPTGAWSAPGLAAGARPGPSRLGRCEPRAQPTPGNSVLLWKCSEWMQACVKCGDIASCLPFGASADERNSPMDAVCFLRVGHIIIRSNVMRTGLLAIAIAGSACSSSAHERPKDVLRLPVDLPAPAVVRQAEGQIMGPDHRPVAGAQVSVIDQRSYRGVGFAVSDRDGRFSVGLLAPPVVVTATANGYVAATLVPAAGPLSFTLARPSAAVRRLSGAVVGAEGGPLAQVRVRLMNWSWPVGAAVYTATDNAGRFQFAVDPAGSYDLMVDDPRFVSNFAPLLHRDVDDARLIAYERDWIARQANSADEPALRELCVPLAGDGMQRFVGALRSARVVGLGESTHGSREFTEVRNVS